MTKHHQSILPLLYLSILILNLSLVIYGCGDDEGNISEQEQIEDFIMINGLDAQKTSSGLHVIIDEPGVEPFPSFSSTITIHYRGYFLNGNAFDSSYDRGTPLVIDLSATIDGWKEGIPYFGTGGKGILLIPSNLAYGSRGSGPIPPDTPLAFDIELISVD